MMQTNEVTAGCQDRFQDRVIVEGIHPQVPMVRIKRGTNVGAKNYLARIIRKDLKRHDMSNVFGNAHPTASFFRGIRRKIRVIQFVIDRFVPAEIEKGANVVSRSVKGLDRNGTMAGGGNVVEQETNIHQAQEPKECR
jgi:hypothetical protein